MPGVMKSLKIRAQALSPFTPKRMDRIEGT
jgi:hypothetical protein